MTIAIDADRLKAVRKARKTGRPKLAKLAGITERQVAKIEAKAVAAVSEGVLLRLSDALQVPAPALTGDFPLIQDDLEPMAAKTCRNGCCG